MSGRRLPHPLRSSRHAHAVVLALTLGLGLLGGSLFGGSLFGGTVPTLASARATDGPELTTFPIGTSVKGRPITVVHRADPGAHTRVVIIGNIHGDEGAGLRVVHDLLTRRLPRNVDLYLMRTANPDGLAADQRTNADHVDLNRNFPYRWRSADMGTTQWSGPRPLSEPESRALSAFVRKIKPALIVIFHQPLFAVGAQPSTMPVARALAKGMGLPVRHLTCGGPCYGSFSSWVNNRSDSAAVTVEFGHSVSDSRIRRAARTVLSVGAGL